MRGAVWQAVAVGKVIPLFSMAAQRFANRVGVGRWSLDIGAVNRADGVRQKLPLLASIRAGRQNIAG